MCTVLNFIWILSENYINAIKVSTFSDNNQVVSYVTKWYFRYLDLECACSIQF